jgi:2-methylcitrate dehydratase PrpD
MITGISFTDSPGRGPTAPPALNSRRWSFWKSWPQITRNTFKPYASYLLTHPIIDAARRLADAVKGREIAEINIDLHPMCVKLAGKPAPKTGLEGKFSVQYCAALGLNSHTVLPMGQNSTLVPKWRSEIRKIR